ncbi:GNAT family N-acetyltransferase [Stakelama tenebrarum]|uniref:GNAT family N-acetyltransferase n=1 Tax=Stakelama tenebrarum TaxID=2711215 RepID=A0A6G6Y7Z3_9SPHN|nr:GNAT family N-acetyltransferase [Sphingosinithalassobacter tenebrarum]QIG80693.1 GNAT family N-acetyltransferase [Sphingosinithalassobacter tenebrarum]
MSVDVKLFDDLDAVAADAGGALDRAAQPRIYNRIDWFRRVAALCPIDGRPLIARARDGDAAAWLFLARKGVRAQALASWYTLDFQLVTQGGGGPLIDDIASNLKGIAHLTLSPVADPAPIAAAFRKAGWITALSPATVTWEIEPPADFESYWASRPGKLRSTAKRKGRKAGLDIAIHREFDADAWDAYREIYEASWKPEEGSWDFMRSFAEAEGAAGTLRLGIAVRDGKPIAAQLWHVENGRATIHKLAYREDAKDLSPGTILSEAMFRHVIEQDRPQVIDYGTGNEPYKADWMEGARKMWRIDCWKRNHPAAWPGLVRHLLGLVRRRLSL